MKNSLLALAAIALLASLSGCVSVKESEPETVSTTTTSRHTSLAPVPATTTVERTTTY